MIVSKCGLVAFIIAIVGFYSGEESSKWIYLITEIIGIIAFVGYGNEE